MRYYILSTSLYIISSIFLYYTFLYYSIFFTYALDLIFFNIHEIFFYIFVSIFVISFSFGTYFSKHINKKIFFIFLGILYYLIGLLLLKNIFNIYITFSIFFILKYFNFEYSGFSNIIYFIVIFFIIFNNPVFVSPLKNLLNINLQNVFSSNFQNILEGAQYQLSQVYMSGYIEAENILYKNGDINGVGILLNNQNNVSQMYEEYLNETLKSYLNYYNSTINQYVNNILNSMYPELSFILSIVFLELFIIFLNINKRAEGL